MLSTKERVYAERSRATERYILSTMPALYLPLDRLDGTTQFLSADGYGHLCTATGTEGSNQGKKLDGVDDKITIPDHAFWNMAGGQWAMAAWLKPDDSANELTIIGQREDANNLMQWHIQATGKLALNIRNAGTYDVSFNTTMSLVRNHWQFLCITENGDSYDNHLDYQAERVTDTGRANNFAGVLSIGHLTDGGGAEDYYDGAMGLVLFYPRYLSPVDFYRLREATEWRFR